MKQGRFSEEQIIGILKQSEAGASVTQLCREHGIEESTFYKWKSKYGGLEVNEASQTVTDTGRGKQQAQAIAGRVDADLAALMDVLSKNGKARWQTGSGC